MIPAQVVTNYKKIYKKAFAIANNSYTGKSSNYAAIDLLIHLKDIIKKDVISLRADEDLMYQIFLVYIYRDIARFYLECQDTYKGQTYLEECIALVKTRHLECKVIVSYINSMTNLAQCYTCRGEFQKGLEILLENEKLYKKFKKENLYTVTLNDIFGVPEKHAEDGAALFQLEYLYTKFCLFISKVYYNLDEFKKSAQYTYISMGRKSESKSYVGKLADVAEFAVNSADLADYYIQEKMFKKAHRYMAAATMFITEYNPKMLKLPLDLGEEEAWNDEEMEAKSAYASVGRRWTHYGIALLAASKERLRRGQECNLAEDVDRMQLDDDMPYLYPDLKSDDYGKEISTDYCLTLADAKKVCSFVTKWNLMAQDVYKIRSDICYAEVTENFGKLYEQMAFFERSPANKYKMQKQRIKYYEEVLGLLDPKVHVSICRDCWRGAASAYCAQLSIELKTNKAIVITDVQKNKQFSRIVQCAIKHLENLIDSFRNSWTGTWIPNLSFDDKKLLMITHFNVGKLYSEVTTSEHPEHRSRCLHYYQTFIDECTKDKQLGLHLQSEIAQCRKKMNFMQTHNETIKHLLHKY